MHGKVTLCWASGESVRAGEARRRRTAPGEGVGPAELRVGEGVMVRIECVRRARRAACDSPCIKYL
jgi:hypothetical protein